MRNLMLVLLTAATLLSVLPGCKKKTDTPPSPAPQVFKGITVTNDMGEELGHWGSADSDWETDSAWSYAENLVMAFPDTVSLDGTYIKDTTGWNTGPGGHQQPRNMVIMYPNPAATTQKLYYGGLGLLKFKAVLVDKYFNRIYTFAIKDSSWFFQLDLSDTTRFRNGELYRLYYSLSAKDSVSFYKGHGDILICRQANLEDCRQYVP